MSEGALATQCFNQTADQNGKLRAIVPPDGRDTIVFKEMSIGVLPTTTLEPQTLAVDQIHHGDCRDLLTRIAKDSVACSVWSPPYFLGKDYEAYLETFEDWQDLLSSVIHLHLDIIKPGGFLAVNIADILCFEDPAMPKIQAENIDRRKSAVTREDVLRAKAMYPDYNRNELAAVLGCSEQTIDRRLNGNNIRGGKYTNQTRVKLVGGMIEEWGAKAGFYLYDRRIWMKDAAWENSKWSTLSYRAVDEFEYVYIFWKPGVTTISRDKLTSQEWAEWGSRGVWQIPSVRANDDHEAKFPLELPRRIIELLTMPEDIVLDPFMGSGTTAEAAIIEGRHYIGIEKSDEYVKLARKRLAGVVNRPMQMEFGGL
jgi:site-specific DNA-methyltransferase (adenine-specific)